MSISDDPRATETSEFGNNFVTPSVKSFWQSNPELRKGRLTKRYLYYAIQNEIARVERKPDQFNRGGIITLHGPRRAGKSTILKQLVNSRSDALYISIQEVPRGYSVNDLDLWGHYDAGIKLFCIDEVSLLEELEYRTLISTLKNFGDNAIVVISGSQSNLVRKMAWGICSGAVFQLLPRTYTENLLLRNEQRFIDNNNPYLEKECPQSGDDTRFKAYLNLTVQDDLQRAKGTEEYIQGALDDTITAYLTLEHPYTGNPHTTKLKELQDNFSDTLRYVAMCQMVYRKADGTGNYVDLQDELTRLFRQIEMSEEVRVELEKRLQAIIAISSAGVIALDDFLTFLKSAALTYETKKISDLKAPQKNIPYYSFAYPWFTSTVFDSIISDSSTATAVKNAVQFVMESKWVEAIIANCVHNISEFSGHYRDSAQREIDVIALCPVSGFVGIEVKNRPLKNVRREYLRDLLEIGTNSLFLTTSDNEVSTLTVGSSAISVIPNELLVRRLETFLISQTLQGVREINVGALDLACLDSEVIKLP